MFFVTVILCVAIVLLFLVIGLSYIDKMDLLSDEPTDPGFLFVQVLLLIILIMVASNVLGYMFFYFKVKDRMERLPDNTINNLKEQRNYFYSKVNEMFKNKVELNQDEVEAVKSLYNCIDNIENIIYFYESDI
jgi:hypothetical protein